MSKSALKIYEILRGIFVQLTVKRAGSDEVDRPSLLRAALSCTAFSGPALDVLWEEIDCIKYLLKILPAFTHEDGEYRLFGPVTSEHWTRLEQYACRIRTIFPSRHWDCPIHTSVYVRISALTKGKPLLPSLCVLDCNQPNDAAFFCLSPNLRRVSLHEAPNTNSLRSFLHALADMAPSLRALVVRCDRLVRSTAEIFARFNHQCSLTINTGDIDLPALDTLAGLENLFVLRFDLPSDAHSHFRIDAKRDTPHFHGLRDLNIDGSVAVCADIIGSFTGTSLESVIVRDSWFGATANLVLMNRTIAEWRALFDKLPRFSQSLREVIVGGFSPGAPFAEYPDQLQFISLVRPLLSLPKLERLVFELFDQLPMSLTDGDIHTIACAWPMIQELELHLTLDTIQPTILALESLARLCPHLRELTLNMDLRVLPSSCPPMLPHTLQTLTIVTTLLDDPLLVAYRLDSLFPFVSVGIWDPSMEEKEKEINRILISCQTARSDRK